MQTLKSPLQTLRIGPSKTLEVGSGWRAGKTTAQRGYGWEWQQARKQFLSDPANVCCRMCQARGIVQLATVVDHIVPHRGDPALFWNRSNWQALCKPCHDSDKRIEEGNGRTDTPSNRPR